MLVILIIIITLLFSLILKLHPFSLFLIHSPLFHVQSPLKATCFFFFFFCLLFSFFIYILIYYIIGMLNTQLWKIIGKYNIEKKTTHEH